MFMVSAVDVIAQDNIAADIRNVFFMLRLSYNGCVVARMTHYIYHPGNIFMVRFYLTATLVTIVLPLSNFTFFR